ncbi:recombination activating protein 1 [Striga asiatica]|uniref:Recombination activating protein 1 n=1 Tax=Striga asiatica TaxID=4170 RepID=A0A5A7P2B2_STRAF|nr:recombination activating protein 1 [Striga asiatica]
MWKPITCVACFLEFGVSSALENEGMACPPFNLTNFDALSTWSMVSLTLEGPMTFEARRFRSKFSCMPATADLQEEKDVGLHSEAVTLGSGPTVDVEFEVVLETAELKHTGLVHQSKLDFPGRKAAKRTEFCSGEVGEVQEEFAHFAREAEVVE